MKALRWEQYLIAGYVCFFSLFIIAEQPFLLSLRWGLWFTLGWMLVDLAVVAWRGIRKRHEHGL